MEASNKETYLVLDLTRYRDKLKEIAEMTDDVARAGATHSRIEDTLMALTHFFGQQNQIGQLLEEIRALYYACDFPANKAESE